MTAFTAIGLSNRLHRHHRVFPKTVFWLRTPKTFGVPLLSTPHLGELLMVIEHSQD